MAAPFGRAARLRRDMLIRFSLLLLFAGTTLLSQFPAAIAEDNRCLYVTSYPPASSHGKQILSGFLSLLAPRCQVRTMNLAATSSVGTERADRQIKDAISLIEYWLPDVVIVVGDDAVSTLLEPYYKDAQTPFVFCGITAKASEFGLPYENATGIVERAPIGELISQARNLVPTLKRVYYVGSDTAADRKYVEKYRDVVARMGATLTHGLTSRYDDWIDHYKRAQDSDLVIVGSNDGIADWNAIVARNDLARETTRFSITVHEWMMPYASFGVTKVSREQGEWAAKLTLELLHGTPISDLPVVSNRRWDYWLNHSIAELSGLTLSGGIIRGAKEIVTHD